MNVVNAKAAMKKSLAGFASAAIVTVPVLTVVTLLLAFFADFPVLSSATIFAMVFAVVFVRETVENYRYLTGSRS